MKYNQNAYRKMEVREIDTQNLDFKNFKNLVHE